MPAAESIRAVLQAGRHRLSLGRTCEAMELVRAHPRRAGRLVECLWDDDPGVAGRAAHAIEELSRTQSALFNPWKEELLGLLCETQQNKQRWCLAVCIPRLPLTEAECRRAASALENYLEDSSSIVKTCALQALADLSQQDPSLRPMVLDLLRLHGRSGTPAMRARCRKLLINMEKTREFASW